MNLFIITTRDDRHKNFSVANIVRNSSLEIGDDTIRSLLSEIVNGDTSSRVNSWAEINNNHIIELENRLRDLKLASSNNPSITDIDENLENLKIEDGRPSGESEYSMGSNAAVSALRTREILLNYTSNVDIIPYEHNNNTLYKLSPNIAFSFNKNQRSKTYLPGNSQGDHISSYISIIMGFINTIRNESGIDQAIGEIRNVGRLLLSDDPDAMEQINSKDIYLSLSSEDRNSALEFIPENLIAETFDKNRQTIELPLKVLIKKSLINDKINSKANLLSELSHYILTEIQKNKDFTVYSRGRIDARKDEGATAKSSIRGLMALDKLCFIRGINEDEKFQEEVSYLLNSLSSDDRKISAEGADEADEDGQDAHLMRYGINAWFEDDGTQADYLKDQLERTQDDSQRRSILNNFISSMMQKNREEKTISAFIGGLFDYDRKLVFDYNKGFPLTKTELESIEGSISKIRDKRKLDNRRIEFIITAVRDKVESVFQGEFAVEDIDVTLRYGKNKKLTGEIALTRNDQDKLVNITAKHLDIMNIICQNVLRSNLTNTSYEQAKKEFLTDSVLKNAGWEEKEGLGIQSLSVLISNVQQKQVENERV